MSIYSSSFQRAELTSKSLNCVSHTYVDTHDTRPHHTHLLRSHYFQCTTKNYLSKKFPLFIFPLISIFTFFPRYFNMTCLWSHFNTFLAIFTLLFFFLHVSTLLCLLYSQIAQLFYFLNLCCMLPKLYNISCIYNKGFSPKQEWPYESLMKMNVHDFTSTSLVKVYCSCAREAPFVP